MHFIQKNPSQGISFSKGQLMSFENSFVSEDSQKD